MSRSTLLAFLALILTAGVAAEAAATPFVITTPSGLNAGDQFFVVFATSTATDATSPVIGTYDAFVTAAAAGITYGGGTPTWRVYGRTHTNDNITAFFTGSARVYLLDGEQIGASATTFALNGPSASPNLTIEEDGSTVTPSRQPVWVGQPFGNELGSFAPVFGRATNAGTLWFNDNTLLSTEREPLYGFSKLTVVPTAVPEPSTLTLALAGIAFLGTRLARRRR